MRTHPRREAAHSSPAPGPRPPAPCSQTGSLFHLASALLPNPEAPTAGPHSPGPRPLAPGPLFKRAAAILLLILTATLLLAGVLAPHSYDEQFRDYPEALASRQFPLGTDALGRDRFSRLLYGGRMSLACAPAAALCSTFLALALGLIGGFGPRRLERAVTVAADLCLSLPWLFALLAARAALPLNAPPVLTVAVTFALLGALGWAGPCRIFVAAVKRHRASDFTLLAHASGVPRWRIAAVGILPNLLPVAAAQFLVTVPAFLLAEANLGLLGLGVPEPLPSLGGMLRELENVSAIPGHPAVLAPALLLILIVTCFHFLVSADEYRV
jgi:ABC-type dipeptide/oligopeptide/nickel transport system permease subunit